MNSGPPDRHLTARRVLQIHADLLQSFSSLPPRLRKIMIRYAHEDVRGRPEWRASHLHPATSFSDLEPWLKSFSTDLARARTYQATAPMVSLAQEFISMTPELTEIHEEELPSPYGFMWLDKPVPRPSDDDFGQEPLMIHAISWARVPDARVLIPAHDGIPAQGAIVPGVRIREWAWSGESPENYPRPLALMGQTTLPISSGIMTRLPSHLMLHMLWVLMDTEVISSARQKTGSITQHRKSALKHQDVTVITLARAKHPKSGDEPGRHVDWSCTWLVRGHRRKAPHGGTFSDGRTETWVRAYIKGPDGKPLRAGDTLYRLSRADW